LVAVTVIVPEAYVLAVELLMVIEREVDEPVSPLGSVHVYDVGICIPLVTAGTKVVNVLVRLTVVAENVVEL
jgi:hypothetical protein